MQRFFFDNEIVTEGVFEVTGEKYNHIAKVLRLGAGEHVIFCDGNGYDYISEINSIDSKSVYFNIVEKQKNISESDIKITVFQCLPKGDKLDDAVKRCVQFGVYEIVPVLSKRCVARPDKNSISKKIERLNKISRSSAMQSMRGYIPKVKELVSFEKAISLMQNYDSAFICYEEETSNIINSFEIKSGKIAVLIGPEGGLDILEVEHAKACGIKSISLGRRILRTEDAASFLIPIILSMTNNL